MKNYKELLEGRGETASNPTVELYQDPSGKKLFAHLNLNDAAAIHRFVSEDILSEKGFWTGAMIQVPRQNLWIRISQHSKFKK